MPTKSFSGIYRLVDREWGGKNALRLYFQDVNGERDPFCIPVWFSYSYKPYRGAGPSFKTDVDVGDVFEIEVGESENKKPVLMRASKIDCQTIPAIRREDMVRPTRPVGLIRKNPKLDAIVYRATADRQMRNLLNLNGDDVIQELRVNNVIDACPYPLFDRLIKKAEYDAGLLGCNRFLLTVRVLLSYYAETMNPLSVIEHVRLQYINFFPELEMQDFAYIRRTYNGNNGYILCWSIVKVTGIIRLDGVRKATQSIYDDSLITEK